MILCYHKIHPTPKTHWWITVDRFYRQMAALQSYDVVPLDRYDASDPNQAVITFDGVYDNILAHALPVMRQFSYPFELFVIGDWIGRENVFDQVVEPPCWFADLDQIDALVAGGARVQWHTRSHRQFTLLDREEIAAELTVPNMLRDRYGAEHLSWFAFPHGAISESNRDLVQARFAGALACDDGDPTDAFNLPRTLVFENHDFFRKRVAVTVSLGDRPWLIRETLDSLKRQLVPPDLIRVLPEDASVSAEVEPVLDALAAGGGQGIQVGQKTALEFAGDAYHVSLRAGDRLRSDHILSCRTALDRNPDITAVSTGTFVQQTSLDEQSPIRDQNSHGRGTMSRGVAEEQGAHSRIDAALVELPPPGPSDASRLRIELCHREGELIQRAAIEDVRNREIERLNEALSRAYAEIDRLGLAHCRNAEEILRLNHAYGTLTAELKRVNDAYGELSREVVRVNDAYGDQQVVIESLRNQLEK